MSKTAIQQELFAMQDLAYRRFQSALLPTVEQDAFIGVRLPNIKKFASKIQGRSESAQFLLQLPHTYYEEDMLHVALINRMQDYTECLEEITRFLPYISNWGVCDSLRPAVFRKNRPLLRSSIAEWLSSPEPYTLRLGIELLLVHFLEEEFQEEDLRRVAAINHEHRYVQMAVAWYFATALALQPEATLPYYAEERLSPAVWHMAVQKALESHRTPPACKALLRELRNAPKKKSPPRKT